MKPATEATKPKTTPTGPLGMSRDDRSALARIVPIAMVPDPPVSNRSGRWSTIYERVTALKPETALEIPCPNQKDLLYGRGQLRIMSKRQGRTLSTSRNADSTLLYAWLEPKNAAGKVLQ